jgi:hypothetical protein
MFTLELRSFEVRPDDQSNWWPLIGWLSREGYVFPVAIVNDYVSTLNPGRTKVRRKQ